MGSPSNADAMVAWQSTVPRTSVAVITISFTATIKFTVAKTKAPTYKNAKKIRKAVDTTAKTTTKKKVTIEGLKKKLGKIFPEIIENPHFVSLLELVGCQGSSQAPTHPKNTSFIFQGTRFNEEGQCHLILSQYHLTKCYSDARRSDNPDASVFKFPLYPLTDERIGGNGRRTWSRLRRQPHVWVGRVPRFDSILYGLGITT